METAKLKFKFDIPERCVNDIVHGTIKIFKPLWAIIDTPEFQRLRRIKQLGAVELVFPSANHSRFSHSLGVYHLAFEIARQLWVKHSSMMDERDILCVSIAGLIHDLGHGPFSHMYDGPFMKRNNPDAKWKHETGTKLMFQHLLWKNPHVKELLDQYLDEKDYVFIEEMIIPPKVFLDQEKNWIPKGRSIEKSFLYDIISNSNDGLDCDKMDYFIRDAKCSGVDVIFSVDKFERLLMSMEVHFSSNWGYNRICYIDKIRGDCTATFQSRIHLHSNIYQHKTVLAADEQYIEILSLADPYLKFAGQGGNMYTMSRAIEDMTAFSKLTDCVIELIGMSSDVNLKPAQDLLRALECRQLYRCIGKYQCTSHEEANGACSRIESFFAENGLQENEYFIKKAEIHQGFGIDENPIDRVCFYNSDGLINSNISSPLSYSITSMQPAGFYNILIYLKSHDLNCDLRKKLRAFIDNNFCSLPDENVHVVEIDFKKLCTNEEKP